jgi:hypothetical protein
MPSPAEELPNIAEQTVANEHLFSYGTLRTEELQLALFGRRLEAKPDVLPGYTLRMIEIQEQDFVIKSGTANHRNIQFTRNPSDFVEGLVLTLTRRELEQADAYEPASYNRVLVQLQSGVSAWVYLSK